MLTFGDEDDLQEDIKEGVAIALDFCDFDDEGYIDDIKLNKLAYFAIQHFDLDITYSWYKYGAAPIYSEPADRGETSYISPRPEGEITAATSSRVPTVDNKYRSPIEYAYFFADDITEEFERIYNTGTKEYLVHFYDENAPTHYKQLYIQSAKLQQVLDSIKDDDDWYDEIAETYNELEGCLNETYEEMLLVDEVSESLTAFQEYSRLIRNVIIAAKEQESLSSNQKRFMTNVVDFFYRVPWKYTALLIAQDTVTGSNRGLLKTSIEDDLRWMREHYERETDSLRQRAFAFSLLPDSVEEMREVIADDNPLPPAAVNEDEIEAWSQLGGEVILNDGSE